MYFFSSLCQRAVPFPVSTPRLEVREKGSYIPVLSMIPPITITMKIPKVTPK